MSKIGLSTAAVSAVLNVFVLLGIFDLSAEAIAGINVAVAAVLAAVVAWFNPNVPIGER